MAVATMLALSACSSADEPLRTDAEALGDPTTNSPVGGQSGGEEGTSAAGFCACSHDIVPSGVARVVRSEGGCVELELLRVLSGAPGFEVGATVGGAVAAACSAEPASIAEGDTVFIQTYERGGQDSWECVEALQCTQERCGPQPRQGSLDEWAACDDQCELETSEACSAHAEEALLGGYVNVVPMQGDVAVFDWAGAERRETPEELSAPQCFARHGAQFEQWRSEAPQGDPSADPDSEVDELDFVPPPSCPLSAVGG